MSQSAHIFNPINDSLIEKVRAYRSVREAWLNIEASLKFANDEQWANTLGETQELEEAHEIITQSMATAISAFSVEEIDSAVDQGLMSKDEASEFMCEKFDQSSSLRTSKKLNKSHNLKR